ncbi:salicylate hydroxylase [Leucogyrophana mollusca]|uniref:Salicylate hydroxylase n=1 Tax=Leucogyrophana mollusca TaxID=85980 RepID=A0ACB8BLZ7_9AGAM|nr:salicylate hydroxylase [Leucogyrophana mollusca]
MSDIKFRVAICGGGVGGLTLALTLSKYPDIVVDVYESTANYSDIGAGVGIWPRAFKVLRKLGHDVERDLLRAAGHKWTEEFVPAINYRKSDQPKGEQIFQLMTKGDLMRFHRSDFHHVLLSHISPSCKVHYGKRLVTYTQPLPSSRGNSPVTLSFTDGSTATCDILVGADGVRSSVRACMMREMAAGSSEARAKAILSCIEPVWSGATAYRTLICAEKLRARDPNHRALKEPTQFFLVYPISLGKYINFAGFALRPELVRTAYQDDADATRPAFNGSWVAELSAAQVAQPFEGFEEETKPLLECVDRGTLWGVHTVKHLPAHNFGRVAILGDAAHAMMPFQGSGAGQGIEDAYLLATVLGHKSTTLATVTHALSVYDKVRRPFSAGVAERSRRNGQLCALQEDVGLKELGEVITKNWEWAWLSELDGAVEEATQMLEGGGTARPLL